MLGNHAIFMQFRNIIFIFVLLLIVVSTGCARTGLIYGHMSQITNKKIKCFCKKEGDITLENWGYCCLSREETIHLTFLVYRELDQQEARKLCIYLLENVRDIFNTTEDMQNYLTTYPCSITDFCILILFSDPTKRFTVQDMCDVTPGMITAVGTNDGYMYYSAYDFDLDGEKWIDKELIMKAQSIAKFKSD